MVVSITSTLLITSSSSHVFPSSLRNGAVEGRTYFILYVLSLYCMYFVLILYCMYFFILYVLILYCMYTFFILHVTCTDFILYVLILYCMYLLILYCMYLLILYCMYLFYTVYINLFYTVCTYTHFILHVCTYTHFILHVSTYSFYTVCTYFILYAGPYRGLCNWGGVNSKIYRRNPLKNRKKFSGDNFFWRPPQPPPPRRQKFGQCTILGVEKIFSDIPEIFPT
jgi:hypothetical protein